METTDCKDNDEKSHSTLSKDEGTFENYPIEEEEKYMNKLQTTSSTELNNEDDGSAFSKHWPSEELIVGSYNWHNDRSILHEMEKQQLFNSNLNGSEDFDEPSRTTAAEENVGPLSERWSPLGANYDDTLTPSSELLSAESELELLSQCDNHEKRDSFHLKNLEEEQEFLTTSLLALTSHFAHVQLRVRQIVEAPPQQRDQLLKDLEEFAFRGIPDAPTTMAAAGFPGDDDGKDALKVHLHQCQFQLIEHLKSQLIELEKLAYESGAPLLPQHILLEKQKLIIDELKQRLNLKVDDHKLPELTPEELKHQVDNALGEIVGPLKMKEQLVAQLKTQISDLERFIAYLQCDTADEKSTDVYNSYAVKKKKKDIENQLVAKEANDTNEAACTALNTVNASSTSPRDTLQNKAHGILDKAALLLQMFATNHFTNKSEQFQKNVLKKSNKCNHWGDLRAQLEVDVQEVASLATTLNCDRNKLANMHKAMKKWNSKQKKDSIQTNSVVTAFSKNQYINIISSDSEEDGDNAYTPIQMKSRRFESNTKFHGDSINVLSKELNAAVRKNFAMTLLRLIQHGLRIPGESVASSLIVPFMRCINPSSFADADYDPKSRFSYDPTFYQSTFEDDELGESSESHSNYENSFFGLDSSRPMHAWEFILEYYYLKHGDEYNNTPARKLSESFNLDIVDGQAITAKQTLLTTIGTIIAMHRPYKRSYSAHFKAFICAGLNYHQLVDWLNLIFNCHELVETYYVANSYVASTRFRDALHTIDALTKYDFDLPVDLAIRHFRNL